jgi:hypothetical protein
MKDAQHMNRVRQDVVKDEVIALDYSPSSFAELRLRFADERKLGLLLNSLVYAFKQSGCGLATVRGDVTPNRNEVPFELRRPNQGTHRRPSGGAKLLRFGNNFLRSRVCQFAAIDLF